jgi:hypothetical protein
MNANIYEIEYRMRDEVTGRRTAADGRRRARELRPPVAASSSRTLLRLGRLVVAWAAR